MSPKIKTLSYKVEILSKVSIKSLLKLLSLKGTIPRINKKFIEYRSFKNFDQEFFLNDLEQKHLSSIVDKCDNVNSAYENFESELISVHL
jgi:hypothetical protein